MMLGFLSAACAGAAMNAPDNKTVPIEIRFSIPIPLSRMQPKLVDARQISRLGDEVKRQ